MRAHLARRLATTVAGGALCAAGAVILYLVFPSVLRVVEEPDVLLGHPAGAGQLLIRIALGSIVLSSGIATLFRRPVARPFLEKTIALAIIAFFFDVAVASYRVPEPAKESDSFQYTMVMNHAYLFGVLEVSLLISGAVVLISILAILFSGKKDKDALPQAVTGS